MKKVFYGLIGIMAMFIGIGTINAESFVEGSFISGEYVSKVKNGVTYYLTMQFIKDSKGNIVYCMEPYVTFSPSSNYTEYEWDLSSYNKLTDKQRRKIELLAYYGYGYEGRTDNKWYVITQVLIWQTVDQKNNIYFTDTLNGNKITKYASEMDSLLKDVDAHDNEILIGKSMDLDYGTNLTINGLDERFEIISSPYEGTFNPSLYIRNIKNDGVIVYKRKSNYYQKNIALFVSDNNQDLIRPGNVKNSERTFTITVRKGDITLDIRDDDSVYSVEKNFSNTCYQLYKGTKALEKVCTSNTPLVFKTEDLAYGSYTIKQVSHGIGYLEDKEVYSVTLSADNNHPVVILYNKLLKNKISLIKYACIKDECVLEEKATFRVLDKYENIVDTITTDAIGVGELIVGYGNYTIEQVSGLEGYSLSDAYTVKIIDEETSHSNELYNYAINNETEVLGEELPPDTGIKSWFLELVDTLRYIIKTIYKFGVYW